jgi:DNA-binding transcriptional LysR family regulator
MLNSRTCRNEHELRVAPMDWDLCKTFVAVVDTRSFVGAARRLRASHPTVGRKMAALEAQLGTKLFARSANGLSLTADGLKFREHAEVMAEAALRAETAVSATGRNARGAVKLSIGATLASHWLMPQLGPFLREHDQIQLEIVTHPFPASVRRREADVVLRPVDSGEENLVGRKIGRLGAGFYASRDYAAARRLPERRHEWKGHNVIAFADQGSNAQLARWSDIVTRQGTVALRCSSQGDMLAATRAGLGISALSCFVGESYPDLVRVAPHKLVSVSDLWLLAHPDLIEIPAVRAVADFVAECARADRAMLRG